MVTVEVEKKLRKEKAGTLKDATAVILETNRLLEVGGDKDLEIMRGSGLSDRMIDYEGDKKNTYIERNALDNKYEGDVFTEEEIENICVKYGLRFLQANKFCGTVASHVPQKLREFCEKNKIGTGGNLHSSTYVMAMDSDFVLQNQLKPIPAFDPEPLLFYKIDNKNFKLIAKWGRDLTIWNYIKAFRRRSREHYVIVNTIILFLLSSIVVYANVPNASLWWIILTFVLSAVASFVYTMAALSDNDYDFSRDKIWNTDERMKGI